VNARVAIVGTGSIGVRHLQGLARCERVTKLDIVDKSKLARERAADSLAEIAGRKWEEVTFHADISTLSAPNIAIVATNARERAGAVSALVDIGARLFVLEKVLFTKLSDYDVIGRLFAERRISAWVNCGRRAYPRAGVIKDALNGRPFQYQVAGQGWGLACNAIHHIDEVAMLSGQTDIKLTTDELAPGSIPAKREGYVEFIGKISGSLQGGSSFDAACTAGQASDRTVTITCDGMQLSVSQFRQTLTIENGSSVRTEPFPIPLQSEATTAHMNNLLDGGAPALPDYATSAKLHRTMLSAFLDHLRRSSGDPTINECPIT